MKPLSLNETASIWPEAPVWTYPGVEVGLPFTGTLGECLEVLAGSTERERARVFIEVDDRVIDYVEIETILHARPSN